MLPLLCLLIFVYTHGVIFALWLANKRSKQPQRRLHASAKPMLPLIFLYPVGMFIIVVITFFAIVLLPVWLIVKLDELRQAKLDKSWLGKRWQRWRNRWERHLALAAAVDLAQQEINE